MSFTVEKLEHSMAKLTITVPAADFDKAMTAAYNKTKNRFNVPGFRKGKVPMAFIEKMYGPEVFYEDAANAMINEYYPKEAVASELEIASQPVIDVIEMGKGKDFVFTAEVAVKPEVTLGDYKGIEVEKIDVEVTDDEVLEDIKKEQLQNARKVLVEGRAAQLDDEVTLDFEGFVDGVPFDGGKGENYKLVLGSHSFIDTFEDQLVGKNIGEDVEVNVTFPEDYQAEELAGKPAVFKCKINSITESQLPELNDEFASEVGGCDTLDQYKEEVKQKILAKKNRDAANEKEAKVLDKVIENATMDIADAQVEDMQKRMKDEFAQTLQYQGISLEQYMQIVNVTEESLMERIKPDALKRIQQRAVLEAVVKAENIEATDEEVDEELSKMAAQYQMKLEDIKGFMGDAEKDSIKKDVAVKKAAKLLGDEVNDATASLVIAQLLFLESEDPSKDISLYINSPGGSVTAGMGIYDTMRYIKCDVSTICCGMAASMGAFLLAGGTKGKRYALPNSEIMIHQPLGGTQGQATEIEIAARHILKTKEKLNKMLSENTGKPLDVIAADTDRDNWMTAEEACAYGLIDSVITNR